MHTYTCAYVYVYVRMYILLRTYVHIIIHMPMDLFICLWDFSMLMQTLYASDSSVYHSTLHYQFSEYPVLMTVNRILLL